MTSVDPFAMHPRDLIAMFTDAELRRAEVGAAAITQLMAEGHEITSMEFDEIARNMVVAILATWLSEPDLSPVTRAGPFVVQAPPRFVHDVFPRLLEMARTEIREGTLQAAARAASSAANESTDDQ